MKLRLINMCLILFIFGTGISNAQNVDFRVSPPVIPIPQVKTMACWAASYAMIYNWKNSQNKTIEQAVKETGTFYQDLYNQNTGLSKSDEVQFITDAGLTAEAPQNFTVAGWHTLLKKFGPLFVITDEPSNFSAKVIHARVLVGIKGNGTLDGTKMTFIDPANGQLKTETYGDFAKKFESEAKLVVTGMGGNWPNNYQFRFQVLHW